MAITDRPGVARMLRLAEERTGLAVRPKREIDRMEVREQEFQEFANEAEELAFESMDYFSGRGSELRPERRKRLAQRSRIALLEDPLAGAEAQLLGDFSFGKGLSIPTARDPKVQDIINEAWTDANNQEKLTSYAAQRKLSNELLAAGELFITLYVKGGKIRVGRLDADLVSNIVPDPEDRLRPLWYVAMVRKYDWDYEADRPKFAMEVLEDGRRKVKYWKHWRNLDDAQHEREAGGVDEDEEPLQMPPESRIAKGVVYHVAINQTGEQLRGNPPWARSLRFFTAMNVLTEAHVTMAQAASTFIARRAMKGTPKQITKAAAAVLTSVGELGASARDRVFDSSEPTTQAFTRRGTPPPAPPGSWFNENESSTLEALNLSSGAGQMAQTAQIVRAPLAATSGFGQHYLGDASNVNLSSASTLELPTTMHIGAWQENFEAMMRWFTDRGIEAAVKEGLLGGVDGYEGTPLGEMRLDEAEDRAAMEDRTSKDLSYEFTMPFPGRRQLTDVATVVSEIAESYDPLGMNVPLRKLLLRLLFEQTGIDNVSRAVEECVPEAGLPGAGPGFRPAPLPGQVPGQGSTASGAGAGAAEPGGEVQQPYGAKSAGTQLQEAEWVPEALRPRVALLTQTTDDLFSKLVSDPALSATLRLATAGKG